MVNGKTARAHWVCRKQSQMPEGIRLNKFLASCGVASRRKCDDLIAEGHVEINGKIVIELGTKVLPTDHVKFDGRRLSQESEMTIILNKPMGYVCTRHDPEGRKTIYELLPKKFQHLNYVGRLDIQSSGLLILTNSGELNELLTHPRYHVHKEYEVYLDRAFDPAHTKAFIDGIPITEGLAKAVSVDFFSRKRCHMVLAQGYNRQIRRMFSRMGYKVRDLERIRIGCFMDINLPEGSFRPMNSRELEQAKRNDPDESPKSRK